MRLLPRTTSWVLGRHRPVVMLVVMGAWVLFNVYAFTQSPVTAVKIAVCAATTLLVFGCGLWVPASKTDNPVRGVPVHQHEQPELWAPVRGIAGATNTAPPDANHLVVEANAAVMEDTRRLGLISTQRHLFIGAPLVWSPS